MRSGQVPKRNIAPDYKFQNVDLGKFINYIMQRGKKTVAQKIVYNALDIVKERSKQEPLEVFDKVVKALTPLLEVRSRRIGGANYQIPMPVSGRRRYMLAFRWLINAARERKGKPMQEKLAQEMLDVLNGIGVAIKKKQDTHRMAEANKAFAHFLRFKKPVSKV